MKVRAAILEKVGGPILVEELDLDEPRVGEVLVRVKACGVCHSDWHLVNGDTKHPLPAGLGHEGAGIVECLGSEVEGLEVGDSVALSWAPFCGECFYCQRGQVNLCDTYVEPIWAGTMLDGTTRFSRLGEPVFHYCGLACFAEYVVVPAICCVRMPKEIPFECAAVIGCAVTTGVGSVIHTAKVEKGASVVVYGAGGVGLSTVMGAKIAGASIIIAVDPLESRRDAALEFGATHCFSPSDSLAQIRELTGGRGADYVFEAIGNPTVQELCLEAARPGGEIIYSGLSPMGSQTNLPGSVLTRQEKTVKGSYYGSANPSVDFVQFGEWYRNGLLPLDRFISHRYALDEINEAFADMLAGNVRRGVVVFE